MTYTVIQTLERRILAHEHLQARLAAALGAETWQGDLAQAVAVRMAAIELLELEQAVVDHALRWARCRRLGKGAAEVAEAQAVLVAATEAIEAARVAAESRKTPQPPERIPDQ